MRWLTSEASFTLAALLVTWAAVALLAFLATSLHIRIRRLEQAGATPAGRTPYGSIIGQSLAKMLPNRPDRETQAVLFVSHACGSCEKLLDEVGNGSWTVPTAVLWSDVRPADLTLPPPLHALDDGPAIARDLGVRATPFLLVLDAEARVVRAGPVNTVRAMQELVGRASMRPRPVPVP